MAGTVAKGLKQLTVFLTGLERDSGKAVTSVVTKCAMQIYRGVTLRSPVDTGVFRASWDMVTRQGAAPYLVQVKITNRLPYAGPLEEGSPKGGRPWPSAGPKTVEMDGRIYSSQAPGGIVDPVLENVGVEGLLGAVDGALKAVGM